MKLICNLAEDFECSAVTVLPGQVRQRRRAEETLHKYCVIMPFDDPRRTLTAEPIQYSGSDDFLLGHRRLEHQWRIAPADRKKLAPVGCERFAVRDQVPGVQPFAKGL
jgi:hypothetical protein